jgi:Skp family chaperone for outer membrane proteins
MCMKPSAHYRGSSESEEDLRRKFQLQQDELKHQQDELQQQRQKLQALEEAERTRQRLLLEVSYTGTNY